MKPDADRLTSKEQKRYGELCYLILEYEITPAPQRPPIARAKYRKWIQERERLYNKAIGR